MKNFFDLKERQQRILIEQTAVRIGIPVQAYCKIGFVQIDEILPLNYIHLSARLCPSPLLHHEPSALRTVARRTIIYGSVCKSSWAMTRRV